MTLDEVIGRITPADHRAKRAAQLRQESLTKPPGSLGRLEALSIQLAGIFGTERPKLRGKTIIVAAGDHGVVPPTRLGRVFADELGRVNQLVAAEADDVYFMAAGLPLKLKSTDERDDTSVG